MESVGESQPKTWGERLRGVGKVILGSLAHVSPYQVSLDPNYFRESYGAAGPDAAELDQRPLPNEQP